MRNIAFGRPGRMLDNAIRSVGLNLVGPDMPSWWATRSTHESAHSFGPLLRPHVGHSQHCNLLRLFGRRWAVGESLDM